MKAFPHWIFTSVILIQWILSAPAALDKLAINMYIDDGSDQPDPPGQPPQNQPQPLSGQPLPAPGQPTPNQPQPKLGQPQLLPGQSPPGKLHDFQQYLPSSDYGPYPPIQFQDTIPDGWVGAGVGAGIGAGVGAGIGARIGSFPGAGAGMGAGVGAGIGPYLETGAGMGAGIGAEFGPYLGADRGPSWGPSLQSQRTRAPSSSPHTQRGDFVERNGVVYFSPQAPDKEKQAFIEEIERKNPGSKLVDGDMLLSRHQLKRYGGSNDLDYQFADREANWPNKRLVYTFDEDIDESMKKRVKAAINHLSQNLSNCITFEETDSSDNRHKVYIRYSGMNDICFSILGYNPNIDKKQVFLLDKECAWLAVIKHELLHALGLYHQHNRPDRDQYITIEGENVNQNFSNDFDLTIIGDEYDLPYDYRSIMHYDQYFHNNGPGAITMITKNPKMQEVIGIQKVSPQDIRQLKLLYRCEEVNIGCLRGNGKDYNGQRARTRSGILCQKWNEDWPHSHQFIGIGGREDHNFCRNPSGSRSVWCYTTNETIRRDWCDVPSCDGNI